MRTQAQADEPTLSAVFDGPFKLIDTDASTDLLHFAGGANRVGIRGAPDGSQPLAVLGSPFVTVGLLFATGRVIPNSALPTTGQVAINSGATATITHNLGQEVVANVENAVGVGHVDPTTNDFDLRNEDPVQRTVQYFFW